MAAKRAGRSGRKADKTAGDGSVKVTLRLTDLTAKRLGVQAVMTGESQSAIAERVLSEYLSGWRLPSNLGGVQAVSTDRSDGAGDAA